MNKIIILGRVLPEYIKEMCITEDEWYFVDYSNDVHPVGSWFRAIIDDEFEDNFVQLIECYADGVFKCNAIPQGYKSICRFKFDRQVNGLPYIEFWTKLQKKKQVLIKINIAELREKKINDILND